MNAPKPVPHWRRRLAASDQPAYRLIADLIADLIAEDVRTGRLGPRDRLPTLRDLADELALNYTTVARGYAEARQRGLIDARPGLGTFVRGHRPTLPLRNGSAAEMTMNLPPEPDGPALLDRMHRSAMDVMTGAALYGLMRYQDFGGSPADKAAATGWLRRHLPTCQPQQVLVCPGIHSALAALISQLARPGELVCVESLVYPGTKALATQFGVQLHALQMDDEGPSADDFEHACKALKPKALYVNPTLRNPDTGNISRHRREALADIALRYSVPIIEDDAYGMLPANALPPLASLAPEITYYLSGLSKCLGAGLRTAYLRAPSERAAQRLAGTLRATSVMASPVTNALATRWVSDGTAEAMLQAVRDESRARQALAARSLAGLAVAAQPEGFHLWLGVPARHKPLDLAAELRGHGVAAVASAAFCTDGDPPDAIRLCLGGPVSRDQCGQALLRVAQTLALAPPGRTQPSAAHAG